MEVENNEKINILVVDDDTICLLITAATLENSKFQVMTAKSGEVALSVLRSGGLSFDFVLMDVHMPQMDGFQLQQEIIKEFDIPIGFMSADERESTVKKGVDNGAVFFLLKPITQDDIHYLWEYATSFRKKKHIGKQVVNQGFQKNTNGKICNEIILIESSSSDSERDKSARKYYEIEDEDSSSLPKKSRIIWTDFLHNKFLEAVTTLGVDKANPRKIQELMNIPELTGKQISSHLQKYRTSLKKDASPKLTPNSSKITIGTANQLSTWKAAVNIATFGQQLMTENLHNAGHHIEADFQHLQTVQKDKKFAEILTQHINQKPSNVQGNYESINAEKGPFHLGNVLPNLEFQQGNYEGVTTEETLFQNHYFPSNSKFELGDHESFTAEECSFLRNVLLNHELEKYRISLKKDASPILISNSSKITIGNANQLSTWKAAVNITTFGQQLMTGNLHNAGHHIEADFQHLQTVQKDKEFAEILTQHINQKPSNVQGNYEGVTTEETLFQHHYFPSNSKFELGDHESFTAEECSFLRNVLVNYELEKENHGGVTTEEGSLQLHNDSSNSKLEQVSKDDSIDLPKSMIDF